MPPEIVAYYDTLYGSKLYEYEALCLCNVVYNRLGAGRRSLLDVACATGRHIEYLKKEFYVEGLDISTHMLEIARRRNPAVQFHCADMEEFHLGHAFDIVMCLSSSIGYAKTVDRLRRAIKCMTSHVAPGGMLVLEPWFTPETYKADRMYSTLISEPKLKIAGIVRCSRNGRISVLDVQYLIGTPGGIRHFTEKEELGLFDHADIRFALEEQGLEVAFEAEGVGLSDKGVFIGRRPVAPDITGASG